MSRFDAKTVALADFNLIEASAGTGKTYTLAELYLRLLLENHLTVDQILVVTYTRAATEELRDRLRQKLVLARDDLLTSGEHGSEACQRLNLAIQSFDEAAIFTIHGFCQRVLADFAFESGLYFDLELIGDDQVFLQQIVDDFWRKHISTADQKLVRYLLDKKQSPEKLLQSIRGLLGQPYLHILAIPEQNIEQVYQQAEQQFEQVKRLWQQEQEAVIATVQNKALLNGNKYRTASVEKWLVLLSETLQKNTVPTSLFADFDRFTPAKLTDALKKDHYLPELEFWSACEKLMESVEAVQSAQALQYQRLRLNLLNELQATMPERKQQSQVQSYDDLLLNLQQALDGERGDELVSRLRARFPAALIDEFQDTDPVQYTSFSRIYTDSGLPVFLVGDPKQAIYSFRGADIFTYLSAKDQAQNEYNLEKNWRSHPKLVAAINQLFLRQDTPFIYQNIPFHPVEAEREDTPVLTINQQMPTALQLLWAGSEKPMAKKEMTALAASVTADEIARVLNLAEDGQATLLNKQNKPKAVSGGDIAVLVRNHRQAFAIQQCLQTRGINSVQQGRDNVFASAEALMLQRVLSAMAEPQNQQRITAALATELWHFTAAELYALQHDDVQWSQQLDLFYDLHQLWQKYGFIRAFRQLLTTISARQQLLSLADGERKLTNLLHLAELIQAFSIEQNSAIEAVLQWFSGRLQSIDPNDETGQLRLESDEQLVKIITIHKSKGLEYPIVFCPFLWDSNLRAAKDDVIRFHAPDDDYHAHVAFAEPALTKAAEFVTQEERAEGFRLLYVALTRAREQCIVCWGNVKGAEQAALFSLLHPDSNELDNKKLLADLMKLVSANADTMTLTHLDSEQQVSFQPQQTSKGVLAARQFKGTIHPPWRIGSFSALTIGHDAELPDYDAQSDQQVPTPLEQPLATDRFSFPRGAQAGTCLHAIFEHWDFASDDKQAMQTLVNRILLQYGFEERWTPVVCQWLSEVLATSLNKSGLCLANLATSQRLDELAFYFPVAGLTVETVQQALLPLLVKSSPLANVISQLRFSDLTGFMKGFIDLVFEHQGRFYIVDYKSNWLGTSEQAYQLSELEQAMISHDYPLQYLIYSLALHRYLRLRMPDYDPDQHLGGAYYLFIRGMRPDWQQAGVFYDKPDTALLDALDTCLQGTI